MIEAAFFLTVSLSLSLLPSHGFCCFSLFRLLILGWSTNQSRRSYLSLLECYKTIHGLNGVNCNDYFEFNSYGKTRSNHSFKFRQSLARVNCFSRNSLLELVNNGILFPKRQWMNGISVFFEANLDSFVKFCKFLIIS